MKTNNIADFFLLADFQHIRDEGLIQSFCENGEFQKAREIKASENRRIEYWKRHMNKQALRKALLKARPRDEMKKISKVYEKHRRACASLTLP